MKIYISSNANNNNNNNNNAKSYITNKNTPLNSPINASLNNSKEFYCISLTKASVDYFGENLDGFCSPIGTPDDKYENRERENIGDFSTE